MILMTKYKLSQLGLKGANSTLYKDGKESKPVTVNEATTFTFKGLDAGKYVLKETKTPDGYNTIKPIEFTIDADYDKESDDPQLTKLSGDITSGVAKFDANKADGSLKAGIVNRKGSLLPSTGGYGYTNPLRYRFNPYSCSGCSSYHKKTYGYS